MRILIAVEPGVDGVLRHVEGLVDYSIQSGCTVNFAYSSVRDSDRLYELVSKVEASGGITTDLRVANYLAVRDVSALQRLRSIAERSKSQVIHGHSSKAGALVRLLSLLGVSGKFFYTPNGYYGMRNDGGLKTWLFNQIERLLGRIGVTINVSRGEFDFARRILRIPENRLRLICNAVDTRMFVQGTSDERQRLRKELNLPDGAFVLGAIGRLARQKDPITMYRAVAKAMRTHKNLFFYHLGQGELSKEVSNLAMQLGMQNRIVRREYIRQPLQFYRAVDGIILTSIYEGLSYTVLEALSCNLPVILSEAPGNQDFKAHGLSHCWFAQCEDADGFTAAINDWIRDFRSIRSSNHSAVAERVFSLDACYGAVLRGYSASPAVRAPKRA